MAQLEVPAGHTVYIAQADVENCFYQVANPPWLCEWFCLEPLSVRELQSLGPRSDIWGHTLGGDPHELMFPCLTALPMGFNWSFWIVQHLHERIAQQSGFPAQRRLTASWPTPSGLGARSYAIL